MKELTLEASVPNVRRVTEFIDAELEALGCKPKTRGHIDVAIDELFSNITRYAYEKGEGKATVRLEVLEDPRTVCITFIDNGRPFNPLERQAPDTSLPLDRRPIGGLGIFITKKLMDAVEYKYQDGQNILQIRKIIA